MFGLLKAACDYKDVLHIVRAIEVSHICEQRWFRRSELAAKVQTQ